MNEVQASNKEGDIPLHEYNILKSFRDQEIKYDYAMYSCWPFKINSETENRLNILSWINHALNLEELKKVLYSIYAASSSLDFLSRKDLSEKLALLYMQESPETSLLRLNNLIASIAKKVNTNGFEILDYVIFDKICKNLKQNKNILNEQEVIFQLKGLKVLC